MEIKLDDAVIIFKNPRLLPISKYLTFDEFCYQYTRHRLTLLDESINYEDLRLILNIYRSGNIIDLFKKYTINKIVLFIKIYPNLFHLIIEYLIINNFDNYLIELVKHPNINVNMSLSNITLIEILINYKKIKVIKELFRNPKFNINVYIKIDDCKRHIFNLVIPPNIVNNIIYDLFINHHKLELIKNKISFMFNAIKYNNKHLFNILLPIISQTQKNNLLCFALSINSPLVKYFGYNLIMCNCYLKSNNFQNNLACIDYLNLNHDFKRCIYQIHNYIISLN